MKKWLKKRTRGQSLVELALTLPLLLLMFVGLIEIGATLRNYLVLVNANREGVRFAARGRWFDEESDIQEIFKRTIAAGGCEGQHCTSADYVTIMRTVGKAGFPANTTIAVTFIQVPDQVDDVLMDSIVDEGYTVNTPWISGTLPMGYANFDDLISDLTDFATDRAIQAQADNQAFNQKFFLDDKTIDIPSEDNFVIVETWFRHEQLLKLPIFTAVLPEEFQLHIRSEMRVTLDSRVQ